jgi:WD40 repeat protein/uncharacterized protein YjbI with pentapeptide repeats
MLRRRINRLLLSDSDIDAFLADYFMERVYTRMSRGTIERAAKINLLFEIVDPAEIDAALRDWASLNGIDDDEISTSPRGYPQKELLGDHLLVRIQDACRMRERLHEQVTLVCLTPPGAPLRLLKVSYLDANIKVQYALGVTEQPIDPALLEQFCLGRDAHQLNVGSTGISRLVYAGPEPTAELTARASQHQVALIGLAEYELLIDLRPAVARQTERLLADPRYPHSLYVPQRAEYCLGGSFRFNDIADTAIETIENWLHSPYARLVLVLGDFGMGKTFLLYELARRLGEVRGPLLPILCELRHIEKAHSLDNLLAQHMQQHCIEPIDPTSFRRMLRLGKVALFFDGFDELALRTSYERATEHLTTLIDAVDGQAKVIITSRPQHFINDQQIKTALAKPLEEVQTYIVRLLPFERPQIRLFLRNKLGDNLAAQRRYQLLDEVKDLLGLSHNPRMLGFIAEIEEKELIAARYKHGTITAAHLYELIVNKWLSYEVKRVGERTIDSQLNEIQLLSAATWMARQLWRQTEGTIGLNEMEGAVRGTLENVGNAAHQLGSACLLVRDALGRFSFLHQSVLEWLVARATAEEIQSGKVSSIMSEQAMSPLMAEFLIGLLGKNEKGEEIALNCAKEILAADAIAERGKILLDNALCILDRLGHTAAHLVGLSGQDFRGKDFSGQRLRGAVFARSLLSNGLFVGSQLHDADLSGADLTGADMRHSDLRGAKLCGAHLTKAILAEADLRGAQLLQATLSGADLRNARLDYANLSGVDLRCVRMEGVSLNWTKLIDAQFGEENLPSRTQGACTNRDLPNLEGVVAPRFAFGWRTGRALANSPDGRLLAVATGTSMIALSDIERGQFLNVLAGHTDAVHGVAFSHDGKLLASGSADRTVRLWDICTGHAVLIARGHTAGIRSVACSPDGRSIASASDDGTARIWDIHTGQTTHVLDDHEAAVRCVAFAPDGSTLATASADSTIQLWNMPTGQARFTLKGHQAAVLSLSYSPDGSTVVTASADTTVRLWEVATGRQITVLSGHKAAVRAVAYGPNGRTFISASDDGTIRLWESATGAALHKLQEHEAGVRSVTYSADGESIVSAADDQVVRQWDINNGRLLRSLKGHPSSMRSIAVSADGETLACGTEDSAVSIWELRTGMYRNTLHGHQGAVLGIAYSPDGNALATSSEDCMVKLWEAGTNGVRLTLLGHQAAVRSIVYNPDGKVLASASDDSTVRLWSAESGQLLRNFGGHHSAVLWIAYSSDGQRLASASVDGTVHLWEPDSGRIVWSLPGQGEGVYSVAFHPDGRTLAMASANGTVKLFHLMTGEDCFRLQDQYAAVRCLRYTPNGQLLVSGSDDATIRIWDYNSGNHVQTLLGHKGPVRHLVYNSQQSILISAADDNTLRVWEVESGRCLLILTACDEGSIAFSPDGRYKLQGAPSRISWHAIGLCRFDPGELDSCLQGLRLNNSASFFNLPSWSKSVTRKEVVLHTLAAELTIGTGK